MSDGWGRAEPERGRPPEQPRNAEGDAPIPGQPPAPPPGPPPTPGSPPTPAPPAFPTGDAPRPASAPPGSQPYDDSRPPLSWQTQVPGVPVGPGSGAYPKASQAVGALVLSILGVFCCGLLSLVGLLMGRSELKAIDAGLADPANRGTAQAAFVIGLVWVIVTVVALALYAVFIIATLSSGSTGFE